ncbi:MAG: adenylyltransferase/cytidyltransferase family protein, partial [Lentisphaeria bacterium]|nr:adenylyltransferase/cytidyltransferase family protein [Lentisphaeria bacterium]
MRAPESKIMDLAAARVWRESLRAEGRRLAMTNGCFDLLHRGHAEYLARARERADALLVAINSDASVRAIKGPTRPVVAEQDRAFLLACLESVDAVLVFGEEKPLG